MIPTMILWGLVFGRWWKAALISSAMGWPILLVVNGVMGLELALLAGAGFGVINAAVGVAIHQGVLLAIRRQRGDPPAQQS